MVSAEQCTEQIIGCANPAHQLVGHFRLGDVVAVDLNGRGLQQPDMCAELSQDFQLKGNVNNFRYIFNTARAVYEKSCRDNRDSGIFCAADGNLSVEAVSAVDDIFRQAYLLLSKMVRRITVRFYEKENLRLRSGHGRTVREGRVYRLPICSKYVDSEKNVRRWKNSATIQISF